MVLIRHFLRYDDTTERIMLALEQMLRKNAEVHKKQDLKIHTDLIFLSEQTVNLFHNQPNRVGLFVHLDKNYAS